LFSNEAAGINGLQQIEKQLHDKFKEDVLFLNIEDPGYGEQYCFIKSLIRKGSLRIKVEILQNIQLLHPIEIVNNVKLIAVADIGMMKLESLSSRRAQKDVYDLDIITDEIPLPDLIAQLKIKKDKFHEEHHKSLFDLDSGSNPIDNPLRLLEFDKINYQELEKRPSHSNDILRINEGKKSWTLARTHWRRKVYRFCKDNNIETPGVKPIN